MFNSWTHDQSEVDIIPEDKPHIDGTYINSTEWDLLSIERKRRYTFFYRMFKEIENNFILDRLKKNCIFCIFISAFFIKTEYYWKDAPYPYILDMPKPLVEEALSWKNASETPHY